MRSKRFAHMAAAAVAVAAFGVACGDDVDNNDQFDTPGDPLTTDPMAPGNTDPMAPGDTTDPMAPENTVTPGTDG